ncbi:hypothetical protein [Rhizobium mesosinicum]|uniref:Uncharacterized protein n=1 Tax=Rhizobium mesosinicum TaxID=335017 RepID=A0ABS7H1Y7_9HYPH|nr:hypothetical protein [Rhizobium mesosinicum]MBW9056272.1 hypothetical protein [Rhizobium mesosinicum]
MKYDAPEKRSEEEITETLSRTDISPDERIRTVLSALYYGRTIEFSGDTLIEEFSRARYPERYWLRNLFETFYGMCRTDYRIDDSIALLEFYKQEAPEYSAEIDCTIDALTEYRVIFSGTHKLH